MADVIESGTDRYEEAGSDRTGLLIAAGAGFALGIAANLVRKAIVQSPTVASGNWADALAAEHRMTLAIFDKIEATSPGDAFKRGFLLMQLKHALTKHAVQEENAVYAELRDRGDEDAADHLNHDHGYIKQHLYDLTRMPKGSPAWLLKLKDLRALIEKHVREEEDEIFPRLRARLSAEENKAVSVAMNKEGLKVA